MRTVPITAAAVCVAMLLIAAPSCVTENPRRGNGVRVRPASPNSVTIQPSSGTPAVNLASGPIATPAAAASVVSRIAVAVKSLGAITYDGQVLPVTSASGRLIAAQEGQAPEWATLLAVDGAPPALETRVAAYRVTDVAIERIDWPLQPEPGLLLGRGADDEGFLVESAVTGAARAIGKVNWTTGAVSWLSGVPTEGVIAANGVLLLDGSVAFVRRRTGDTVAELVVRARDGSESARRDPSGTYSYPIASDTPGVLFALVQTPTGIDIEAISLRRDGSAPRLGSTIARRQIAGLPETLLAYQVAASAQPSRTGMRAEPGTAGSASTSEPIAFFHPGMGRTAIFDPSDGAVLPLAAESQMAVPWSSGSGKDSGYFCATPTGIVYVPRPRRPVAATTATPLPSASPEARVLSGAYAPRGTNRPDQPLILFSPDPSDLRRLRVLLVGLPDPR